MTLTCTQILALEVQELADACAVMMGWRRPHGETFGWIVNDRLSVARNPNTPAAVLAILAKDNDSDARYNVAKNPNTPVETLALLAKDSDAEVRLSVARNPSTPATALAELAKDRDADVRYYVTGNPNTLLAAEQRSKQESARKVPTANLKILQEPHKQGSEQNLAEHFAELAKNKEKEACAEKERIGVGANSASYYLSIGASNAFRTASQKAEVEIDRVRKEVWEQACKVVEQYDNPSFGMTARWLAQMLKDQNPWLSTEQTS